MQQIRIKTKVTGHYQEIFQKHDQSLFEKFALPLGTLHILKFEGMQPQDEIEFTVNMLGKSYYWKSVILATEVTEQWAKFTDIGKDLPFPLISWQHQHIFHKVDEQTTIIEDHVNFECGSKILESFLKIIWYSYFVYRSLKYKQIFT